MSRKTVSRGTAAVALVTFLTLAGATPTLATPRHSGEPGVKTSISVWGFVMRLSEHLVSWAFGASSSEKAWSSGSDTTDISMGADPNGNELSVDPSGPGGTVPAPIGGRG